MTQLTDALSLTRAGTLKNRFVLAPMTNGQSHDDGRLGDAEHRWLVMRAEGGFALTMTCAATVQKEGVGFPGQLGIYSDDHLEGLQRLAADIKAAGIARRCATASCRDAVAGRAHRPRAELPV